MTHYPLEGQAGISEAPSNQGALSAEISPEMIEAGVAALIACGFDDPNFRLADAADRVFRAMVERASGLGSARRCER